MRCCGTHAKIFEQLDSSSHLFLCGDVCRQPLLYLVGLIVALVQSLLLLLVWARAEANMFYEMLSHGLVNETFANESAPLLDATMLPSPEVWSRLQLGQTGEDVAVAGNAGGASFAPPQNTSSAYVERRARGGPRRNRARHVPHGVGGRCLYTRGARERPSGRDIRFDR